MVNFTPQNPSAGASTEALNGTAPNTNVAISHLSVCPVVVLLRDPNGNPQFGQNPPGTVAFTVTVAYAGAGVTITYPNGQVADTNWQVLANIASTGPLAATPVIATWLGANGNSGTVTQQPTLQFT